MLVSVVTPSFNQVKWLGECLHSVAVQDYAQVEHIVQDGGSTDGSVSLLERSSAAFESEKDGGQSDAILKAYARSRGQIIGWINSDDALADTRTLTRVAAAFASDPRLDIVYGHALDVDGDGRFLRVTHSPRPSASRLHRDINPIKQPAAFVSRAAIERFGFIERDLHFVMDHEWFIRMLRRGARARRLTSVLSINRHQADRKSLHRPPEYAREYAHYRGVESKPAAVLRSLASASIHVPCRLFGAIDAVSLPRQLAPACTIDLLPTSSRLRMQLATRIEKHLSGLPQ